MSRGTLCLIIAILLSAAASQGAASATTVATNGSGGFQAEPPPPVGAAPDAEPPGKVAAVRATLGNRSVTIRWSSPADSDFDRVEILRSTADGSDRIVYAGNGEEFVDRSLRKGVLYMYELRSVDRSGNASDGVWVAVTAQLRPLFSPEPNERIYSAPTLRWEAVPGARYYNVQLYRGSRKVLSAWPRANRLALRERWTFAGQSQRLATGEYHWFVWPGRGPRSRSRYGPVLGRSSFVIGASRSP